MSVPIYKHSWVDINFLSKLLVWKVCLNIYLLEQILRCEVINIGNGHKSTHCSLSCILFYILLS